MRHHMRVPSTPPVPLCGETEWISLISIRAQVTCPFCLAMMESRKRGQMTPTKPEEAEREPMTDLATTTERDDVLFAFHQAYERPEAKDITEWVRRYPQFAEDIRAHAAVARDWAARENDHEEAVNETMSARAYSRALNIIQLPIISRNAADAATAVEWVALVEGQGGDFKDAYRNCKEMFIGRSRQLVETMVQVADQAQTIREYQSSSVALGAECDALRAQVAELTRERNEARETIAWHTGAYPDLGISVEEREWPNGPGRIVTWRNSRAESAEAELAALRLRVEQMEGDGWVRVEERLPENSIDRILVASARLQYVGIARKLDRFFLGDINHNNVSHWQPCPSPPALSVPPEVKP